MTLTEIRKKFENGGLTKPEYIDAMYGIHKILGDYKAFLKDTVVTKIELTASDILMSAKSVAGNNELKIACVPNDKRTTTFEMLNFGSYEWEDCESLFEFVKDGQTIFDIGANIGWYSLNFANNHPNTRIFAFEPIPATFQYLNRNIGYNGFSNIFAHNVALSNEEGQLDFFFNPDELGASSSRNIKEMAEIERVACPMTTLDKFAEINKIEKIDLIKCDVEGAELLVFQGAVKSLEKFKPIVFTEMLRKWSAKFGYHPNDIIHLFTSLGYQCFVGHGKTLTRIVEVTSETIETNYFFLHPEKHQNEINRASGIT